MKILHLYICPNHIYKGHHGKAPGTEPMVEMDSLECVRGKGIMGDRYFQYKPDFKGQITFFSYPVYEKLCQQFSVDNTDPSVFRRNVLVDCEDLNKYIGEKFQLQGIDFEGTEEAAPCYWMNQAFCEGAHEALKGRGGLRAKILSDGILYAPSRK